MEEQPKNADLIIADDKFLPIGSHVKFDLVFIDTSHEKEHTKYEIDLAKQYASKWVIFDDYNFHAVKTAINEKGINVSPLIIKTTIHEIGVWEIK